MKASIAAMTNNVVLGVADQAGPSPSLSDEINASTRDLHTKLNRLIIARLPLALPPYSSTPETYARGLSYVATFYFAFESAVLSLIDTVDRHAPSSPAVLDPALLLDPQSRPAALLAHIHLPLLLRTTALKSDLARYLPSNPSISSSPNDPSDPLSTLKSHIAQTASKSPLSLLAYSWIFYMALFSGGRWIRAQLAGAGAEFWGVDEELLSGFDAPVGNVDEEKAFVPFAFLRFAGTDDDGCALKAEFKRRFGEVGELLQLDERKAVIDEARVVFKSLIGMVERLDQDVPVSVPLVSGANQTGELSGISVESPVLRPLKDSAKRWEGGWMTVFALVSPLLSWYTWQLFRGVS